MTIYKFKIKAIASKKTLLHRLYHVDLQFLGLFKFPIVSETFLQIKCFFQGKVVNLTLTAVDGFTGTNQAHALFQLPHALLQVSSFRRARSRSQCKGGK